MSFSRAILYFFREAGIGLARAWRTSLLAVSTIGVSLFLAGVFLLISMNLGNRIASWRAESRIVLYLEDGAPQDDLDRVAASIERLPWVRSVEASTGEQAASRFAEAFPSMEDLLDGWDQSPLPASVAVEPSWSEVDRETLEAAVRGWLADPAVSGVDDDRDWLAQLETVSVVLRGLATIVGGVLILTAVFTIASVIRLAAHQHRDEIAVLRLVGATEFFIRGPFLAEGLIQGALGGIVAVFGLVAGGAALSQRLGEGLLGSLLVGSLLPVRVLVGLVALGAIAGLVGAILSLGKERVESQPQPASEWGAPG